jgi:sortase A
MFFGVVLMLVYPSLWVYGKVSQVYLHREWNASASPTSTASADSSDVYGRLVIPKLFLDDVVLKGIEESDLARGPGHFPGTGRPGEGNCVIAGHLNINGSPFKDLDKLNPGDLVMFQGEGSLGTYRVTGSHIISPEDTDVLDQNGKPRLTLLTCMPGARQRYTVVCKEISVD